MEIYIDRDYVKAEFKKVLDKWDYKMSNGFDMYDQEKFLDDLVECILKPVDSKRGEIMENEHVTVTLTEEQLKEPSEIIMMVDKDTCFMKFTTQGIFFNHEKYPTSEMSDFAKAFIELMERQCKIKFIKKSEDGKEMTDEIEEGERMGLDVMKNKDAWCVMSDEDVQKFLNEGFNNLRKKIKKELREEDGRD